jgi:hypothetical protein
METSVPQFGRVKAVRAAPGATAVVEQIPPEGELDEKHLKFTVADLDEAAFSSLYEWEN